LRLEISHRTWKVFWRNFVVFRKTWLANIMFNFVEPLLYLGAMGLGLGAYVPSIEGLSYLQFIAPGIIASSAMWATASECTYDSFTRMHYQKIYHALIVTPISLEEIVLGELLFGTFKGVLYGTVILLVETALGLILSPLSLFIPLVLALSCFTFAELSMIWTGLVPKIDTFSYYFTLVITPMFLFSGIFFPIQGMPSFARGLAFFSPLYHTVELIRSLTLGQVPTTLWLHILWLIVFSVLLFYPPIYLLKQRLLK